MSAEQLHQTQIRLARETSPGSGQPDGAWVEPPRNGAAVERRYRNTAQQTNPYRQTTRREVIHSAWALRTEHEIDVPLLQHLLEPHLLQRSGDRALTPDAPEPSWVVETVSPMGSIARYGGVQLGELRIGIEQRRTAGMTATWSALWRTEPGAIGAGQVDPQPTGPMIPTRTVALRMATGGLSDPEADRTMFFAGQIFLTRKIQPANYGPDRIAALHRLGPWSALAEIQMPAEAQAEQAFRDRWAGGLAFDLPGLTIQIETASGFVGNEDLVAFDWRTMRLAAEAERDNSGAILTTSI